MTRLILIISTLFLSLSVNAGELWLRNITPAAKGKVDTVINDTMECEEFRISTVRGRYEIESGSQAGLMYAMNALERRLYMGEKRIEIHEKPAFKYRILNHWDNYDDSVERGYAGRSVWGWTLAELPKDRICEYARLCASVGINGIVLNNVNATESLKEEHLRRSVEIAEILRAYSIRTYLCVPFNSPIVYGGLHTADPLAPEVASWWKREVDMIYSLIPDFGGFLIKANSEGQSGPLDYSRTWAEGANVIADALAPHDGILMWRTFVHPVGTSDPFRDSVDQFADLDGMFKDNVILQIKNGPLDFQPREPLNPLFLAMKNTALMPELQLTQEYFSFSNALVYLAPLFKECLDQVASGCKAVAGVANVGMEDDWCGHLFAQSNFYAFGRLAWEPSLTSEQIAKEWTALMFPAKARAAICEMMLSSRETMVEYMTPLGLVHMMDGSHYFPAPWKNNPGRADWQPYFYHRADNEYVGIDRSSRGTGYVQQYPSELAELYDNPSTCPEEYLLSFHRLPWTWKLSDGETVWENICRSYERGACKAESYMKLWQGLEGKIDDEYWEPVMRKLYVQCSDAIFWKDACIGYFQSLNGLPLPEDVQPLTIPYTTMRQIFR